MNRRAMVLALVFGGAVFAQPLEQGIPVTDPLMIAKCGTCHVRDGRGNMQRISWERTTPEGWQEALKRMIVVNGVSLTPAEARQIVKYLATDHGLAPEEAKAVMYDAERRVHHETGIPDDRLDHACARCHNFARVLSWRRSIDDWKQLIADHSARYKLPANDEALAFLAKAAPLHTPAWDAWSARRNTPDPAGHWLVTAYLRGHGKYYGDLQVQPTPDGDFTTSVRLTSVDDGTRFIRSGRSVVYGGYAWRGRSKGPDIGQTAPDHIFSEAREALWIAPDGSTGEGRWFWGQYQEFGFDVQLRRAPSASEIPTLLLLDRSSLKVGSEANRIRLIGDHLEHAAPADLDFGPGTAIRRIVSSTPSEVVAEVDVASDAALGKRDVGFRRSVLPKAIAIYDRIDYLKLSPDSAMAAFGDPAHARGYQQFEAIGYQRGPDGRLHTPDDVELGPVDTNDITWSLEVFYAKPGADTDFVGQISPSGFFTPAAKNPNGNFDVWVVATSKSEKDKNGKPLVGKSYMVVTVPMYTLNGRRYVRDLDRWIDDGPAQ
jgi:quinohemoprotein amine dehydrogenase